MRDRPNVPGIILSADDLREFPRLLATFFPMQWVGDETKGFHAEPAQEVSEIEFDVTLYVLAMGPTYSRYLLSMGQCKRQTPSFTQQIYNSPFLQNARSAPLWVKQWLGPSRFQLNRDIRSFWKAVDAWLAQKLNGDPDGRAMRPGIPEAVWRVLEDELQRPENENVTNAKRPLNLALLEKEHDVVLALLNRIACLSAPGDVMSMEAAGKIATTAARKAISEIVKARDAAEPLPPEFRL